MTQTNGVFVAPEPDNMELQEAISKGSFQHDVTNLEPATTYSLYLKAYSALGASQQSATVAATTLGGGKSSGGNARRRSVAVSRPFRPKLSWKTAKTSNCSGKKCF